MSKRDHIDTIQRVLDRAGVQARIKAERLSYISSRGPRASGWRVSAELPDLSAEQRRTLHEAAMGMFAFGVTEHYHPMEGHLHRISVEGK